MGESVNLPPLVAPGPELSLPEIQRYARNLSVPSIGDLGQRRLRAARVLCLGAGGLGSPAILYLAAAGIGTLGIVDDDAVELSNLQRQVLHGDSAVGTAKAGSAAVRVRDLNPDVNVVEHRQRLTAENAVELVSGYDLVLDGSDTFETRYVLSDACALAGVPHVWGSILRFDGQLSVFWAEHGPTYRDLHPVPPAPGSVPNCAEAGVLGALPGVIGSAMALEAMKVIMGVGSALVGRVSTYDALDGTWATIPLVRSQAPVEQMFPFGGFERDGYGTEGDAAADAAACGAPGSVASSATASSAATAWSVSTKSDPDLDTVGVVELQEMLTARDQGQRDFLLVDVREPWEHQLSAIPGAVLISLGEFRSGAAFERLCSSADVVLHCQGGVRSGEALGLLRAADSKASITRTTRHLAGGKTAWDRESDDDLQSPRSVRT
ncbi:molybdopterin-synthase adenylyltransferase MoeB [Kocuria sp.]|uniref:molybdopterin-synthase adenylyltransferase MoeB n=1 Tax=Kocuria sp. TaxID=1871328 RepID=UPI0026E02898|nr:molybdopterin-synthase adenylyltransferase MoeB [Kocuria sp.]MDO5617851.1 molybdopterin-synthase adenylyltransferase MoeB [Kocuria sp.]